ncbi:MAG: PAS domain-containing sensor histidine kinase [Gemmatimonadota bacterium]
MNLPLTDAANSAGPQLERRAGEARLRAIIDQIADGIVIVDPDGSLCFANAAAEQLFGRSAAELRGEQFGFPVIAGDSTEIDLVRASGPAIVAELRATRIEWDDESCLLISIRDITDRKRSEDQARELASEQAARAEAQAAEGRYRRLAEENALLYERAQAGSRAKSEFLAVVSHELRTPLNAIVGYTDLLDLEVSGTLTEAQRSQLTRIRASARHLIEVVDDILTYSRLEAGREKVLSKVVDFAAEAEQAADLVRPLADARNLSLTVDAQTRPLSGLTDARKVRQILTNLLSNAVAFTRRGTVGLEVTADDQRVVMRVRDTGIGIPADELERIWEPFSQVEGSHTRSVNGIGLGLSVVYRLTQLLGGSVSVESVVGDGTTFTVRLPRVVEGT